MDRKGLTTPTWPQKSITDERTVSVKLRGVVLLKAYVAHLERLAYTTTTSLALPIVAWITEPAKEETDVLNLFTKFLAPLNTCRDDD